MPDGVEIGQPRLSRAEHDPEWDQFVAGSPGGDFLQTSQWAEVKRQVGWRAVRLAYKGGGSLLGGCQLLLRDLPVARSIAYVPRGPLARDRDPAVTVALLDALKRFARSEGIVYLKVQPPVDRQDMVPMLLESGFVQSGLEAAPTATTRLDLRRSDDQLLSAMRPNKRSGIRQAQRRGVTVRIGGSEDVGIIGELVGATGQRQGEFSPYPRRYYEQMWHSFSSHGQSCLLLAERDEQVLAFVLLIAFRDAALFKVGGWSGEGSDAHPNELLHWTGIRWAKDRGLRYYDFDGLHPTVARAAIEGRPLPQTGRHQVPHFKLRFGGEVVQFIPAYDFAPGLVSGWALRGLAPRLGRQRRLASKLLGRRR